MILEPPEALTNGSINGEGYHRRATTTWVPRQRWISTNDGYHAPATNTKSFI